MPQNPFNYKTQTGLINALARQSEKLTDVSLAWWFQDAKWALVKNFGWEEAAAAKFVAAYKPLESAYKAESRLYYSSPKN